jgi:ABC-type sugar transport system ATPase subunit
LAESGITAQVTATEYLGADTLIACRFGSQDITVACKGKSTVRAKDFLKLNWQPDHMYLFHADTGKRFLETKKDPAS